MNTRSILSGLLLLLAVGGIVYVLAGDGRQTAVDAHDHGVAPAGAVLPADGVVVYYFHGDQRCHTCNKMESLADRSLSESFPDQLRDGRVVFRAVNFQSPEGRPLGELYELTSTSIVMVERQGGIDRTWRRLDEIWFKVRDEADFKAYITANLQACLSDLGLDQG